jgi:hypothetical protein
MARAAPIALIAIGCGGGPAPVAVISPVVPRCDQRVLSSQADVAAFATCPVAPALAIRTGAELDLSGLSGLREVEGDLVIGPSVGLATVELAGLERVGGTLRFVGNGSLGAVVLPRLTRAGAIEVQGNVELRMLRLPALAEIGGPLVIERTPSLALIDAGVLHTITGELVITDAPDLTAIEAAALVRIGGVRLTRTGLVPERAAALEAIPDQRVR